MFLTSFLSVVFKKGRFSNFIKVAENTENISLCVFVFLAFYLSSGTLVAKEKEAGEAPLHGNVSKLDLTGSEVTLVSDWNRPFEGKMWIGFIQKGALYGYVIKDAAASRRQEFALGIPANLPAGQIDVHLVPIAQKLSRRAVGRFILPVGLSVSKPRSSAWGVYREQDLTVHPWSANKSNMMIWDGEPYIPFGGMINTHLCWMPRAGEDDKKYPVEAWKQSNGRRYELLQSYGLDDVFFNGFAPHSNPNTLKIEVELAEKHNMRYGIHVSYWPEYSSKGFTFDRSMSFTKDNLYRIEIESKSRSIKVTADIDKAKYDPPHRCLWVAAKDDSKDIQSGIAVMELVEVVSEDAEKPQTKYQLEANIEFKKPVSKGAVLSYMPELPMGKEDIAGYLPSVNDYVDRIRDVYGSMNYGPGLRSWIDPFFNETHAKAVTVPSYPEFAEGFAAWLYEKYGSLDLLNKYWRGSGKKLPDFIVASRLVPMLENAKFSLWIDPETSDTYRFATKQSDALRDLKKYRGGVCQKLISRLSEVLKSIADVPVILKHNTWISDWFVNPDAAYGQDGIGYEAYCYGDSLAYHNTLVPYAEILASGRNQLAWITETSAAAFEGQKDYVGYVDRVQMMDDIDLMMMYGAKGYYHFGFSYAGNPIFNITEIVRDVRQLEWLSGHRDIYLKAASRLADYRPDVYGWYPGHLRERQVLGKLPRLYEMDGHYTGVPTQIRMAPDGRWILPALRADADWYGLLVAGDLMTGSQIDVTAELLDKGDKNVTLLSNVSLPKLSKVKKIKLDGFTANGIGVIEPDDSVMTLKRFRKEVLGYEVFKTADFNANTMADGSIRVWVCVERDKGILKLPASAKVTDIKGKPVKLSDNKDGRKFLELVRPSYDKHTENLPDIFGQGYYYPDKGQPEVVYVKNVTPEQIIALNSSAYERWLPANVSSDKVVFWQEAEGFETTTFTQPRIEGYSRYSNGIGIGINTHYPAPKYAKKGYMASYNISVAKAVSKGDFWIRKMDKPSMDVEILIDGKLAGVIKADDPMEDSLHLNAWNAGIGVDDIKVGWAKIDIAGLKAGEHKVELVAVDEVSKDVEIDTQLMGGAAEKHIGAMAEGRAMRCLQLDAWMITQ